MRETDVLVIGGGIIGLASAWRISIARPALRLAVVEKEAELALHQTGRNSGVIHSGIYYRPGSLKAINCRRGKEELQTFCDEHEIPYELCGKVIVAVEDSALPRLDALLDRGRQNGVACRRIDADRLRELEPHARGISAIEVSETGIVDFRKVALKLAQKVCDAENAVVTESEVISIERKGTEMIVEATKHTWRTRLVVNCAGLYSDRIGRMLGGVSRARIVPFRGEYFQLVPHRASLCRNLIYPVPDPRFPFLGVHLTRLIDGSVHCGPNAVLALAREGYRKSEWNLRDVREAVCFRGLWRLGWRHARTALSEVHKSLSKPAFVAALQRLVPELQADDLVPSPAGIRAQALMPNGQLVDDFLIEELPRAISVLNAPSPAATASLNIGRVIAEKAVARFD